MSIKDTATHSGSDVTRREFAESALTDSQKIFQLLVEAVSDYSIFALDADGFILTWNTGAERVKGYSAVEAIGSHFSRFYTAEDLARQHPQSELKLAAQNGTYQEEGWRIRKDGSRFWASVVITALRKPDGTLRGFGKVTRDLTERKLAEDKLSSAYEDLEKRVIERTAELARAKDIAEAAVKARDEFLSIASHELKTPLTSLQLQSDMRKRRLAKGKMSLSAETLNEMLTDDHKQISRLIRLVDDMLDITRLTTGKMALDFEKVNLKTLVNDILSRFAHQLESVGVAVEVNGPEEVWVRADPYRLEQVFINLLTNGMKYGAGKPLSISIHEQKGHGVLTVKDQGIGIAIDDHARVFEQFERAVSPGSVSGLGLGLYIVKQIVDSHGGQISVESEINQGSTFTVQIPLIEGVQ